MRKFIILILPLLALLTGCKDYVVYSSNDKVSRAVLEDVPPGEATDKKTLYNPSGSWQVTALSADPKGRYACAAGYTNGSSGSRSNDGELRMYLLPTGDHHKTYDQSDFIDFLEFPIDDAAMWISRIGWRNTDEMILHMQPQTPWIESAPQNVSLVIDVSTDEMVEKIYTDRSAPYAIDIPSHPSKTKYTTEKQGDYLYIDGDKVDNLGAIGGYDVYFE